MGGALGRSLATCRPLLWHFDLQADGYLDGLLLPPAEAESGEDSAVESVSWGRIKASLEME